MRYIILLFVILSVCACRKGGSGSTATLPLAIPSELPILKDSVENVNIYLENSHSMGGYFRHPSSFYANLDETVSDLILKNSFQDRVYTFTISDTLFAYDSVEKFRSDLDPTNGTRIATADSSPLDKILSTIYRESGENDISILVSDGIISGSNDQLRNYDNPRGNRYYNKDFVNNLKNDIKVGLNTFKDQFAIQIYAFRSDFIATSMNPYYKLDNSKITEGTFPNRPYYFFVIGKPDLIKAFEKKCPGCQRAIETMAFGEAPNDNKFKLTKNYRAINNCLINGEKLSLKRKANTFQFALLLDLKNIPQRFTAPFYLNEKLLLYHGNALLTDSEISVYPIDERPKGKFNEREKTLLELQQYTHIAEVTLVDFNSLSTLPLSIRLESDLANWHTDWSSPDDLNIDLNNNQTFGFVHLINGIAEAYEAFKKPVMNCTIKRDVN